MERLVKRAFPEDPVTALKIVAGESGFNPTICSKPNPDGTRDCGLWQINDVHLGRLAAMGLDRKDPHDATKFARYLYDANKGWGDWSFYNNHLSYDYR